MKALLNLLFMFNVFLLGINIGVYYHDLIPSVGSEMPLIKIEDVTCSNDTLSDQVYCFRDYIKTFYNYTDRDERNYTGNQGSIEDVKLNGGDCYDYTRIYLSLANQSGLLSENVKIYPENGSGHTFAVIWDKELTGYCQVDQLSVNCFRSRR